MTTVVNTTQYGLGNLNKDIADMRVRLGSLPVGSNPGGLPPNKIILYPASGAPAVIYEPTQAGLVAALAAAVSGDQVWCPKNITIALTTGVTIPGGVILQNPNLSFSGFSGDAVTLSSGSILVNFNIFFNGSGQAVARGIVATGVTCMLDTGASYAQNATTNTAIELSGVNSSNKASARDIYGEAKLGTTAIGMRLGDWTNVNIGTGAAEAATNNIGVRFAASSATTASWCFDTWGQSYSVGSYGMEVEAGKYANIVGGFARGVAAGLRIDAGATASVYGLQWSSLSNLGTLIILPGSGSTSNTLGWFNVEDYGAIHDGSTDDTAAIQAAINACAAAGGGTIYFPGGTYVINGALQDGARGNAQLLLPAVHTTSGQQIPISLLGQVLPSPMPWLAGAQPYLYGVTLKGTLNSGAGGALLGGWGPVGSSDNFSLIIVRIENLAFEMPANPVLSALNLSHIASAELDNVFCIAGTNYDFSVVTQPTTATSYGIDLPAVNNGAIVNVRRTGVMGFYNGIRATEHADIDGLFISACYIAMVNPAAGHAVRIGKLLIAWCVYALKFTGAQHLLVNILNIEHYNPAQYGAKWFQPVTDIEDPSNYGIGRITYHITISVTGADDPIVINGATNLQITSIHTALGLGTVTSIATGTGLTGGPITGSGTISDATSGVTAATYGDASNVGQFAVNAYGRITSASNVAIVIAGFEVLMADGITPADPLLTEDQTDWLYGA